MFIGMTILKLLILKMKYKKINNCKPLIIKIIELIFFIIYIYINMDLAILIDGEFRSLIRIH